MLDRNLNLAVIAQLAGVWLVTAHHSGLLRVALGIAAFVYGVTLYRRTLREMRQVQATQ